MSIIEEAARRLEQLKNAGISVPEGQEFRSPALEPTDQSETGVPLRGRRRIAEEKTGTRTSLDAPPLSPGRAGAKSVQIDLERLRTTGIITPESPRSKTADEFRILKRPLLANARGGSSVPVARGNLIMVTSSLPGEGKSFVSVNLAMSIAMEVDSTVLLVDGDVIAPGVPHVLGGLPLSKGLVDLLTDRNLDVGDVLLRTNVPRLSLLPAGTANERASELLASAAMMELLDELSSRYTDRIVLFDSPPLLPSTESRVLASKMGQIVMVVEADQTPQSKVKAALATIESCPVVQLVLNKVAESELGTYYGYHYGASTPQRASLPR